jgi:hypothetical protein
MTINGKAVVGFTDAGGGHYTVTYTVTQGDTDRTTANSIPLSIVLVDAAGNSSAAYTTPPTAPKLDANAPVISNVTFTPSSGWRRATQAVTVNITTASSETGLTLGGATVNGEALTGFGGSTTAYTATYTVVGTDTNWPINGAIPVSIVVVDEAGNPSTAWTTSPAAAPGIDTQAPTGYTASFDQTFANIATSPAMSFTISSAETGTTYNYTVSGAGHAPLTGSGAVTLTTQPVTGINVSVFSDGTNAISLSVTLTDPAGNQGGGATATVTKDTVAPLIVNGSSTILNTGSASALIGFSKAVYGDPGALTAILANSLQFKDTTSGPTQTVTPTSTDATAGVTSATFNLSWSPPVAGSNDAISVIIASNAIYDAVGNPMAATTLSNSQFKAREVSLFGTLQQGARAAVRGASGVLNGIGSLVSTRSAPTSAAPEAAPVSSNGVAPGAPGAVTEASTPRDQFYQPMPAADHAATAPASASTEPQTAPTVVASTPTAPVAPAPARAAIATAPPAPPATDAGRDAVVREAQQGSSPEAPSPGAPPWWVFALGVAAFGALGAAGWAALRLVTRRK